MSLEREAVRLALELVEHGIDARAKRERLAKTAAARRAREGFAAVLAEVPRDVGTSGGLSLRVAVVTIFATAAPIVTFHFILGSMPH